MELSPTERKQMAGALDCEEGELDEWLERFRLAAEEEYFRMILGQRVFTRGSDIREFRLFLMIKHAFTALPTESEVSAIFQTTATQSRSLLRAVMSKYQYDLSEITQASIKTILDTADVKSDGSAEVVLHAENLVDALNQRLAQKDGHHMPVRKKVGTTSVYEISKDSYRALKGMS